MVETPYAATFMGCVGKDKFGTMLEQKAKEAGVNVKFQYSEEQPTGTCAVLITQSGKNRSLCTNLAAARLFSAEHLEHPDNFALVEEATHYHVSVSHGGFVR